MAAAPHRNRSAKRRSPQGELRNLTMAAREKLHSWFREQEGKIPYHEIQKRLKDEFDIKVGFSTLSNYYNEKYQEIQKGPDTAHQPASPAAGTKTIVIRIEVPVGCTIGISTEEQP